MAHLKNVRNKQAHDYELIAMCYHEAGHAVIGIFNSLKVAEVKIIDDNKDLEGWTYWDNPIDLDSENVEDNNLLNLIVCNELETLVAGITAERIYYKDICGSEKLPRILKAGSSQDISEVSKCIKKYELALSGPPRTVLKNKITDITKKTLLDHWDAVKAVAHELYRKRNLNFEEIKIILTKKTKTNSLWKEKYKLINIIFDDKQRSHDDIKILLSK